MVVCGEHLPILLGTVYALAKVHVGVSNFALWLFCCSRGYPVAHSG